ncbi:MAG TPA: histidine kinase dimerization/phospho-acceptor domain-containing protein [Longimicrobiales bacterium]|nr:histidine kinase dimerization/phospho-acceptor domain-containing protein [Longimicrobiales bacterium]
MSEARPVYVVGAHTSARDRVVAALAGSARVFDEVESFLDSPDREPGITYLLWAGMDGAEVLRAVERMAEGRGEWTPVVVREEGGKWVARTLTLGYPHPLDEAAGPEGGEDGRVLLELRRVLAEISRARHDINNPLTSALAETQLLLMDVGDGEVRTSLQTVLEQLRRIRDLVAGTSHLRPLE